MINLDLKKVGHAFIAIVLLSLILAVSCVFIPWPVSMVLFVLLILATLVWLRSIYGLLFLFFLFLNMANYLFLQADQNYLYYYLRLVAILLLVFLFLVLLYYFIKRREVELIKYFEENDRIFKESLIYSPSPTAVLDKDLRFLFVSESYLKEFSLKSEKVIGKRIGEISRGLPHTFGEIINRCVKGDITGDPVDFTVQSDGTIDYSRWKCRLIKDHVFEISALIIWLRPDPYDKKVEKSIMDQLELQNQILSSIPALLYIRDLQLKFVMVNKAFSEFTGKSQEEIIGKTDYDLYSKREAAKMQKDDQEVIRSKKPKFNIEEAIKSKDNETLWFVANKLPLYDSAGDVTGVLGITWDVSLIKKAQAQLRALLDNFPYMAWLKDVDGKYLAVNKEILMGSGKKIEAVLGKDDYSLWPKELAKKYREDDRKIMKEKKQVIFEEYTLYKGKRIYSETIKRPIIDEQGNVLGTVGFARDITDRKKMEEKIKNLAYYDPLTGLPNRILFNDRLSIAIEVAKRNKKILIVAMLDFNRFKAVNDAYGHDVGDEVLKDFSARMLQTLRKVDTVARMSGDEFLFAFPDVKTRKDMETLAKKILSSFERPFLIRGHSIKISGSMGVCVYPEDGEETSELIKNADVAMYKAKKAGENLFHFY